MSWEQERKDIFEEQEQRQFWSTGTRNFGAKKTRAWEHEKSKFWSRRVKTFLMYMNKDNYAKVEEIHFLSSGKFIYIVKKSSYVNESKRSF